MAFKFIYPALRIGGFAARPTIVVVLLFGVVVGLVLRRGDGQRPTPGVWTGKGDVLGSGRRGLL